MGFHIEGKYVRFEAIPVFRDVTACNLLRVPMFETCRQTASFSELLLYIYQTARHHNNAVIRIFTHVKTLNLTLKQDFVVLRSDRRVSSSTTL